MRISLSFIYVFFFLFGCVSISDREKSPEEPGNELQVRNAHSMAYHTKDSSVYLFGGANQQEVLSDLWVLADTGWTKIKTNEGPSSRTFAPLTYEHENNRLLLFGGSKVLFGKSPDPQNLLNDTWDSATINGKKSVQTMRLHQGLRP